MGGVGAGGKADLLMGPGLEGARDQGFSGHVSWGSDFPLEYSVSSLGILLKWKPQSAF